MENKERIEMDIADAVMERPVGFNIRSRCFYIYPPTLGKTYLLARLFKELDANQQIVAANPYMEAMRLCEGKKDIVCRILSYQTFNKKKDIFNNAKITERADFFRKNLDLEELATLLVLVLTSDNLEAYISYLGIDKERKERKRITDIKKDTGSLPFGGNSVYGTLIDFACQRYGWTMDYVVWGISHTNLRMLMADAITTIYLSKEERRQLNIFDNKENINADDARNEDLIDKILSD